MSTNSSGTMEGEVLSACYDENIPPESNSDSNTDQLNEDSEYIGEDVMFKDEDVLRIGLINIRGLPESNEHAKNEHT